LGRGGQEGAGGGGGGSGIGIGFGLPSSQGSLLWTSGRHLCPRCSLPFIQVARTKCIRRPY
jgi:hypothetical protein